MDNLVTRCSGDTCGCDNPSYQMLIPESYHATGDCPALCSLLFATLAFFLCCSFSASPQTTLIFHYLRDFTE